MNKLSYRLIQKWDAATLKHKCQKTLGVDISPLLQAKTIELVEDPDTCVQYYRGCLPGDDAFYSQLSKAQGYYSQNKWEFQFATERVSKLDPQVSLLDIGCGSGYFLEKVRAKGYTNIQGVEFNQNALSICSQKGLHVTSQTLKELIASGSRYDVICAFQVLEHVDNPSEFTQEVFNLLNDGGMAIFGTPNRDSFLRRYRWHLLDMPPHHLSKWNATAYQKLSEIHQFRSAQTYLEPLSSEHAGAYIGSFFERMPNFFKLRSILLRCSTFIKIPHFLRRRIPGHTIVAVLTK